MVLTLRTDALCGLFNGLNTVFTRKKEFCTCEIELKHSHLSIHNKRNFVLEKLECNIVEECNM